MRVSILIAALLTISTSVSAEYYWGNKIPLRYELSWKLSQYTGQELLVLKDERRTEEICSAGTWDHEEHCDFYPVVNTKCIGIATGTQGEYDYSCTGNYKVLSTSKVKNLRVKFTIISEDDNQSIKIDDLNW